MQIHFILEGWGVRGYSVTIDQLGQYHCSTRNAEIKY